MKKIGILALQGNYYQHRQVLDKLKIYSIFIKYPDQFNNIDALIIPGGESSVISKLIEKNTLRQSIIEFSKSKSIFGTCAGMILMSSTACNNHISPLNLMDFTIKRNAWGKQINSFSANILINEIKDYFLGYFIRSPKIKSIGSNIKILANYKDEPVMLTDGKHLVSSFHPEIGDDVSIHKYFIDNLYD